MNLAAFRSQAPHHHRSDLVCCKRYIGVICTAEPRTSSPFCFRRLVLSLVLQDLNKLKDCMMLERLQELSVTEWGVQVSSPDPTPHWSPRKKGDPYLRTATRTLTQINDSTETSLLIFSQCLQVGARGLISVRQANSSWTFLSHPPSPRAPSAPPNGAATKKQKGA